MNQSWTRGLDKDRALEIKGDFKSSHFVRARLTELINDKIIEDRKASIQKEGYDSPSWAYKMADNAGFERALQYVINLISDKE